MARYDRIIVFGVEEGGWSGGGGLFLYRQYSIHFNVVR